MKKILLSGLINIEVTLQVESFPIEYFPVRYPFFGVNSTVSGVGFNVAKALKTLGDDVSFLSITGKDLAGSLAVEELKKQGLSRSFIVPAVDNTPHSVILYDHQGRRQINVDLKNIQDQVYPRELFERAAAGCSLAALCNINFSRPFLQWAQERGIPVATDVHAISRLDDEYNSDFMKAAHILFMSDEALPVPPVEWVKKLRHTYGAEIIVIGLGASGALLSVKSDNFLEIIPAEHTRPVVNTIGAGDALFSAFTHFYRRSNNPYDSINKAMVFASYKIGHRGAAEGFLDEKSLMALWQKSKL